MDALLPDQVQKLLRGETRAMATRVESGPPASSRPTGTVTFLFSDIEGSTVRWERDRDAMAAALARHDAVMRTKIESFAPRLLGYVDTRLTTLEALRVYTEQQEYDKMLAALRDRLGADDLAKLMDEGREWSEDQAVVEALHV